MRRRGVTIKSVQISVSESFYNIFEAERKKVETNNKKNGLVKPLTNTAFTAMLAKNKMTFPPLKVNLLTPRKIKK